MKRLAALVLLVTCSTAHAGPWTREAGSFFVQASGARLATRSVYLADFNAYTFCLTGDCRYVQQQIDLYAEVGVIDRWLTLTGSGTVYRQNDLEGSGRTSGVGDARLGAWTGLLIAPIHAALGVTVGVPSGDASPSAGPHADAVAARIARSLPLGDGEWNVDLRLSLGESWGGGSFPLRQSLIAEGGAWLRTAGYASSFVYKLELATRVDRPFFDRATLVLRLFGVESRATDQQLLDVTNYFGQASGVSDTALGAELRLRIWKGLFAAVAVDSAVRGRALPDASLWRVALSYDR